ncbi:MAG: hypothetical protein FJ265_05250 [Planctomycetes bacterium]|nr:hypothetical protein [Planctomycetota bacterium]
MSVGGVALERSGAAALLLVGALATALVCQRAGAACGAAAARERQLDRVQALLAPGRDRRAGLPDLGEFDGLFAGQRLAWRRAGPGLVLWLEPLPTGGAP